MNVYHCERWVVQNLPGMERSQVQKKGDVVKLRNSLPQDAEKAKNIYELKNREKFVEEKSSEGYELHRTSNHLYKLYFYMKYIFMEEKAS